MYFVIGIGIIVLIGAFGIYMLWKTNEQIKRDQEYVQSKILKTFVGPTGPLTLKFKQIADACVTDHVTTDAIRTELHRLVDDGRVIQGGDWDFGFAYWLPETVHGVNK
jgi:hypothetical protein